ncbi:hypothetical protein Avbf_07595, partial [Armadillidium vulgare]
SEISFKSISGRIYSLTVSLSGFILFCFYGSFLFVFLTVDNRKPLFTNLDGLYEHRNTYKLIMTRHTSIAEYFQHSNSPMIKNMWNNMLYLNESDFPFSTAEGVPILLEGKIAGIFAKISYDVLPVEDFYAFQIYKGATFS